MLRRRAEAGFTVVELLVVVVLLGVVGGVVTSAIITGMQSARRGEDRVAAVTDLQKGIERVGRELRAASPLIPDADDYDGAVGAEVVRNGQRITYHYYLHETAEGTIELREDVRIEDLDGTVISDREGLFIADVANRETGTPLFTYYVTDPATGELDEIECTGDDAACRDRHATAEQVRLSLEKTLPEQEPVGVETIVNIRSTRLGGLES